MPTESVEDPQFRPARIMEIELSQPLTTVSAVDEKTEQQYHRALVLVRLHTYIVGVVELKLGAEGASPAECAEQIWQELSQEINAHLEQDGLPPVTQLSPDGLTAVDAPPCQKTRREAIEAAVPISVVIATVNRTDSLKITLDTLLAQDYPDFDIIIVDNAPHLGVITAFIHDQYSHIPKIRCVSEKNPGLAHAHNRGLAEVTAPIVAFTDDDVILDRYWLAELAKGFNASDKVACVTGWIFPFEMETPSQEWIEQFGGFNKGFSCQTFDLEANRVKSILYPYTAGLYGSGANMAFRTAILRDLGGFDSALGAGSLALGGDDLAAFFSVVISGYQLVYEPGASLYHMHRRDYAGLRRQIYGYGVGLVAYLMSVVWHRPSLLLGFIARVPPGIVYLFSASSPKNINKATYPDELTWLERKGMIYGPLAYLRSWWRTRSWEKPNGQPSTE